MSLNATSETDRPIRWWIKCMAAFFACVAMVNILATALEIVPPAIAQKFSKNFYQFIFQGQLLLPAMLGIAYGIYWHKKGKACFDSSRTMALFLGILRYWLALELCLYGFAKILKSQFSHSFSRGDTVVSGLSGFNLTWHYFSYSYELTVVIAGLQIGGAVLLLFRRTTLLATVILLPVMINITLINLFYHIAIGAFLNAILFTLGLLFLLLLRWKDLKKIFLHQPVQRSVISNRAFSYLLKIIPVACGFFFIYHITSSRQPTWFPGKWSVQRMIKNTDTLPVNDWQVDARIWSSIYMEEYGAMSICDNPFLFDSQRARYGTYVYDSAQKKIIIAISDRADTLIARVHFINADRMEWRGKMGSDSLHLMLTRTSP